MKRITAKEARELTGDNIKEKLLDSIYYQISVAAIMNRQFSTSFRFLNSHIIGDVKALYLNPKLGFEVLNQLGISLVKTLKSDDGYTIGLTTFSSTGKLEDAGFQFDISW